MVRRNHSSIYELSGHSYPIKVDEGQRIPTRISRRRDKLRQSRRKKEKTYFICLILFIFIQNILV